MIRFKVIYYWRTGKYSSLRNGEETIEESKDSFSPYITFSLSSKSITISYEENLLLAHEVVTIFYFVSTYCGYLLLESKYPIKVPSPYSVLLKPKKIYDRLDLSWTYIGPPSFGGETWLNEAEHWTCRFSKNAWSKIAGDVILSVSKCSRRQNMKAIVLMLLTISRPQHSLKGKTPANGFSRIIRTIHPIWGISWFRWKGRMEKQFLLNQRSGLRENSSKPEIW